jgi:TP901 family phage tail tape measure protein
MSDALEMLVRLKDALTGPAAAVVRAIKDVEKVANAGKALTGWGERMSVAGATVQGVADRIAGRVQGIVQPAYELEDALAAVATVSTGTFGSVAADVAETKAAAREWSLQWSDSAAEFAQAHYVIAGAGLDTRQAIAGTRAALTVATAAMGTGTDAADLLAKVYNTMGDRAADVTTEMTRLGDIIVQTQSQYQIKDLNQLRDGLVGAVPAAKMFGMSIEQTAAAIGQLNTEGLSGSTAGTAFNAMMRSMRKGAQEFGFSLVTTADGGLDFAATMAGMRAKLGDFGKMSDAQKTKLQQVFGDEGLKAIAALLGKTDELRGGLDAIKNSTGAAAAKQAQMEGTGSKAWENLGNHVADLKTVIADGLAPSIEVVIEHLKGLIGWAKDFATAHPGFVKVAAAVATIGGAATAALAPVLVVFGTLSKTVGGALAGAAKLRRAWLWLSQTPLAPVLRGITWLLKGPFRLAFAAARVAILTIIPTIWSFTAALLANPLTWIVLAIGAVVAAIVGAVVYWDELRAAVGRAWAWIVKASSAAWDALVGVFEAIVGAVTGLAQRFWDAAVGLWDAFIDGIKSAAGRVVAAVGDVLDTVRDLLPFSDARKGPLSALTASGRALPATLARGVRAGAPELAAAVAGAAAGATAEADGLWATIVRAGQAALDLATPQWMVAALTPPPAEAEADDVATRRDRRGGGRRDERPVIIERLVINMSAQDAAEAQDFVGMLRGLAAGHGY